LFVHIHNKAEYGGVRGASVAEVAEKNCAAARRGLGGVGTGVNGIAEFFQKFAQFAVTAVYVSYDVKGACLFAPVVPEFGSDDLVGIRFFGAFYNVNVAEAFFMQVTDAEF
jgi:hypothetical protein